MKNNTKQPISNSTKNRSFTKSSPKSNKSESSAFNNKNDIRKTKSKFVRERNTLEFSHSSKLDNKPVRLNKIIADSGLTSRRNADELIKSGVVKVNGILINQLGTKVNIGDKVTVKGNPIPENDRKVYLLLNKPKDIIVSVKDEMDRKTVLDLVQINTRIFPVGRLDRNTTGALLLTNDGELAHRLLHPSYQVERTYVVLLDKELQENDASRIAKGIELEDGMTAPCKLYFDPRSNKKVILTLREGRNHEVKRIFMHLGYNVKQLDRKVFADISIQKLQRGEYRQLSKQEVAHLRKLVKIDI